MLVMRLDTKLSVKICVEQNTISWRNRSQSHDSNRYNSSRVIFIVNISKILHHARARGERNANSKMKRWEKDRKNGDIYGEESLGIFVEFNIPVSLEAPHLCHAHVTWYSETDFELRMWSWFLKGVKYIFDNLFRKRLHFDINSYIILK